VLNLTEGQVPVKSHVKNKNCHMKMAGISPSFSISDFRVPGLASEPLVLFHQFCTRISGGWVAHVLWGECL